MTAEMKMIHRLWWRLTMRQQLPTFKAETENEGTGQGNAEDAEMPWQTTREAEKYSY